MSQLVVVWDEAVLKNDVGVLSDSQGHLALHFLWHEASTALLYDKRLDASAIVFVPGPDNHITERSIADPPLLAIENPAALNFSG